MGTTTTSLHVQIPPGAADATADTIAKAIEKLGYKRLRKASAAADKHVVLLRPEGARFVAVFDRDNAALDSGELRELAALVTHELATAALHVSVLDSDSGEVVVYRKGKQVDAVGVGMQDDSPARLGSAEDIAGTGSVDSPFADDRIASWCRAADLDPAIALAVFDEVAANPEANHLHFARAASRRRVPAPPSGGVDLRFFTDDDNRPEHLVYPAAWPVQAGFAHPAQWFAVSEGAGFSAVRVRLGIDPACGLSVFRIALSSSPFHNGQVMGNPVATFEWKASPSQPWWDLAQAVEIADFKVPAPVAGSRSRQILVLTLSVGALRVTDGEVRPILEVIAPSAHTHAFTPLRFAVIEPAWTPFVMRPLPVRRSAADPLYPDDATREQAFRLLNGSGVVSAFAVLADPEGALSSARALAGALLAACNGDARAVLRTQTPMTQGGNSSKSAFETTVAACIDSPKGAKAFASPRRFQNASIEIWAPGLAAPVAGFLYYAPVEDRAYGTVRDPALHACAWCIDAPPVAAAIGLTPVRLRALFEDWIAGAAPLQAWLDDSAWRPAPGTPDDRAATPYELVAGVYSRQIETAQLADTCRRRLRYVAGVMWLGSDLLARVDGAALEQVAGVTVSGATARIALREDVSRHDLERALEAILPEPAPLAPE